MRNSLHSELQLNLLEPELEKHEELYNISFLGKLNKCLKLAPLTTMDALTFEPFSSILSCICKLEVKIAFFNRGVVEVNLGVFVT